MTSSKSYAPFIVMLSIFSRVQLSVLKIAKSHNEKSCSASKNWSYAVSRITIGDVINKLRPINSHVVSFSRLQLSVLKIAKSCNEISRNALEYGSYAVFRLTINDVIKKLRPIYMHVVYIFAPTYLSFENSKKS